MVYKQDWIPRTYSKFIPFANNFTVIAVKNGTAWKINAGNLSLLGIQNADTIKFYAISSVKKTSSISDKENTRKAIKEQKATMRQIGIGEMKTNLFMTDVDRSSVGVINDSGTHTLSPVAEVAPTAIFTRTGNLGGKFRFIDPATEVGGRPAGQDGISISFGFYAPGTTPPLEVDCTQTVLFSRKVGGVVFAPANINKLFIGYVRYKNTRNILGTVAAHVMGTVY